MSSSLVTTDAFALVPAPHSALAYAGATLVNPLSLAVMAFAICVGVGYAGVAGAIAMFLVISGSAMFASCSGHVRRALDAHFEYRARAKRESERQRMLKPTGPVRQQQYIELRDLVAEIERIDPGEAKRFELQDLLDQFIALASKHQRCLDSLRLAGGSDLPHALPEVTCPGTTSLTRGRSTRRREILARRIRHRDECFRRIEQLVDELDAIDELIRLVAQRSACPSVESDIGRDIERRLWELDEVDHAIDQLSA